MDDYDAAISSASTEGFDANGVHEVDVGRWYDLPGHVTYFGAQLLEDGATIDADRPLAGEATVEETQSTNELGTSSLDLLGHFVFTKDETVTDNIIGQVQLGSRTRHITQDQDADQDWGGQYPSGPSVRNKTINGNVTVEPGTQILIRNGGTLTITGNLTITTGPEDDQANDFVVIRGETDVLLEDNNSEYGGVVVQGTVSIDGMLMVGGASLTCAGGSIDHSRIHGVGSVVNTGTEELAVSNTVVQGANVAFKGPVALTSVLVEDCLDGMVELSNGETCSLSNAFLNAPVTSRDGLPPIRLAGDASISGTLLVKEMPRNLGDITDVITYDTDSVTTGVPAPSQSLLGDKGFFRGRARDHGPVGVQGDLLQVHLRPYIEGSSRCSDHPSEQRLYHSHDRPLRNDCTRLLTAPLPAPPKVSN